MARGMHDSVGKSTYYSSRGSSSTPSTWNGKIKNAAGSPAAAGSRNATGPQAVAAVPESSQSQAGKAAGPQAVSGPGQGDTWRWWWATDRDRDRPAMQREVGYLFSDYGREGRRGKKETETETEREWEREREREREREEEMEPASARGRQKGETVRL